jgi:hypothetical protein
MGILMQDVSRELKRLEIDFQELNEGQVRSSIMMARTTFSGSETRGAFWEQLDDPASYYREQRSVGLEALVTMGPQITVILDDSFRPTALTVESGEAFKQVLDEMYGFVWYAINRNWDLLVCENDHEFVLVQTKVQDVKAPLLQNEENWIRRSF